MYINSTNYTLRNHDNPNGKKAIFIRDSFGVPVSWFLINNFESIRVIDQRHMSKGYLVKHLEENDYDVVLGLNYYNSTWDPRLFNYFD